MCSLMFAVLRMAIVSCCMLSATIQHVLGTVAVLLFVAEALVDTGVR